MALANDFFGLDALGYDPYHQQRMDYYSRLQSLDGLLQSGQQAATPAPAAKPVGASQTPAAQAQSGQSSMYPMGDLAAFYSSRGVGGNYNPSISGDPEPTGHGTGNRPGPGGSCPAGTVRVQREGGQVCLPCRDIGQIDDNGTCRDVREGEQVPCPTGYERDSTGNCVRSDVGTGTRAGSQSAGGQGGAGGGGGAGGSSTVNIKGGSSLYTNENIPQDLMGVRNSLAQFFMRGGLANPAGYPGNLSMALPGLTSEAGTYGREGVRAADDWANMFTGNFGAAFNGGLPDITSALSAIEKRGMGLIEDLNAQTREQFGAMGLGTSSDVNEALARGSSRGIADIIAQQSELASRVHGEAANRRVATLGLIPGMTSAAVSPYFQGAGQLMGLAGLDLGLQEGNINRAYTEFLRTQQPQFLNEMLGFATGFPPAQNQKPTVQGGGWGALAGGLIGGLGSLFSGIGAL